MGRKVNSDVKKDDKSGKQRVKNYLLPSIRLPGRGLPLNMAAVHPKMILTHTREREERKGTVTVHHREKWEVEEKLQH